MNKFHFYVLVTNALPLSVNKLRFAYLLVIEALQLVLTKLEFYYIGLL